MGRATIKAAADKNLQTFGADLHSFAMDSHCLKLIHSSMKSIVLH